MSDTFVDEAGSSGFVEKLLRYRHLLPPTTPDVLARMNSTGHGSLPVTQDEAEDQPMIPAWPELSPEEAFDRALGSLLGLAVGDATGAARSRAASHGAWTRATSMALHLGDAILATGTVDLEDFVIRLKRMLSEGMSTLSGQCVGLDEATRTAIKNATSVGEDEEPIPENGATVGEDEQPVPGDPPMTRLAPLVIACTRSPDVLEVLAARQSRVTHGDVVSVDCCRLFAAQLIDALRGADKDTVLGQRVMALCPEVLFISGGEWRDQPKDGMGSTGHAARTLEAALWSIQQTDDFRSAVLMAAELGSPASGTAAVTGQLAGALYGASAISGEWLETLARRERLELLAIDLLDLNGVAVEL